MTTSRPGPWCCRVVELAAWLLPADRRERYAREFVAELYGLPRRQQRAHALQVLAHALALRAVLRAAGPTTAGEDTMITTTRRPWRCRLGMHDWDERENPETKERYQICTRCDAYHERPQAIPGAGGAGVAGSAFP